MDLEEQRREGPRLAKDDLAFTLHREVTGMAQNTKPKRKTSIKQGKAAVRSVKEPSLHELLRQPNIVASATLRFACRLFVKVTHPEYLPHEVMALVKQGQAQLDPLVPGQVGTLILN